MKFTDSRKIHFILIILTTIILYLISSLLVKNYYLKGLPYYDSVGSYWHMFWTMNTVKTHGFLAGLEIAKGYSLSWLMSFFALLTSRFLPANPQSVILLNFLCLVFSQLSIYHFSRVWGLSQKKAAFVSFLPLIFSYQTGWRGGYIDMRRDFSMLSLLITSFFVLWFYLIKPKITTGIFLGFFLALTQWSRGNALPYIGLVIFPVYLSYLLFQKKRIKFVDLIKKSLLPFIVFIVVSFPYYYLSAYEILYKYIYGSWGIGSWGLSSFRFLAISILLIFFGPTKKGLYFSAILLLFLVFLTHYLFRRGRVKINYSQKKLEHIKPLFFSGLFSVVLISFFNTVVLGIGELGYLYPHFPLVVGFIAIIISIVYFIDLNSNLIKQKEIILPAVAVFVLAVNLTRIIILMPEKNAKLTKSAKAMAQKFGSIISGKKTAYLWLEHIHVHDLNFYLTQSGKKPIFSPSVLMHKVDVEMPPDPDKSTSWQQAEYLKGLKTREYIVISENLKDYENKNGFFFIFKFGRPVIEKLLKDPEIEKVTEFSTNERTYYLLKNISI